MSRAFIEQIGGDGVIGKHAIAGLGQRPFVFTFTRGVCAWVCSRHRLGAWSDNVSKYWSPDIDEFMSSVPWSVVEDYFREYTRHADFVGHVDQLPGGLVEALPLACEDFNADAIWAFPPKDPYPVRTSGPA